MNLPHVEPMVLVRAKEAFDDPEWIYEVKFDGFRAVAYVEDGQCDLVSRKKYVYRSFQDLAADMAKLPVSDAILDGELACLGSDGRAQFNELLYRRGHPLFCAFDLLWLNGRDLRNVPLIERKRMLRKLLPPQPSRMLYVDHHEAGGIELFQAACRFDLEGIVAKWKHGVYTGSDETSWVKIKNPAYSQQNGRHEQFSRFRRLALRRAAAGQCVFCPFVLRGSVPLRP